MVSPAGNDFAEAAVVLVAVAAAAVLGRAVKQPGAAAESRKKAVAARWRVQAMETGPP